MITTSRLGDMSPSKGLKIIEQNDGDVIISIVDNGLIIKSNQKESSALVEFCMSGGRSYLILPALRALAEAMREANKLHDLS